MENKELIEKCKLTAWELVKVVKGSNLPSGSVAELDAVQKAQLAKAIPLISAEARKQEREEIMDLITDKRNTCRISENEITCRLCLSELIKALKEGGKEAE